MTIEEAIENLDTLYSRMNSKECDCVDTTDISLTAVDIAIEALEALKRFEDWRKEGHGDDD